jgi:transposase InsO family protein
MRRLDELHLEHPVYGSRRLTALLRRGGQWVNRKRVIRLLQVMGLEAIYPKRHLSQPGEGHEIFPYLLKGLAITGPDQVWCADITYVPMATGFMYLVAVMDWWSRYVLGWRLSNTMDAAFCVDAWEAALRSGRSAPLISNTDQGSQFGATPLGEAKHPRNIPKPPSLTWPTTPTWHGYVGANDGRRTRILLTLSMKVWIRARGPRRGLEFACVPRPAGHLAQLS